MREPVPSQVTRKQLAEIAGHFGRELQAFSEELREGRESQYAHRLADGGMVPVDRQFTLIARQFQQSITEMVLLMGRLDQAAAELIFAERAADLQRVRADARGDGRTSQHWDPAEPLTATQRRRREELGTLSPRTLEVVHNGEAD